MKAAGKSACRFFLAFGAAESRTNRVAEAKKPKAGRKQGKRKIVQIVLCACGGVLYKTWTKSFKARNFAQIGMEPRFNLRKSGAGA